MKRFLLLSLVLLSIPAAIHAQSVTFSNVGRWTNDPGPVDAVAVRDSIVYLGAGGDFHVINISDPAVPDFLYEEEIDGVISDITLKGDSAWVTFFDAYDYGVSAIQLFDVSDPANTRSEGLLYPYGDSDRIYDFEATAGADTAFTLSLTEEGGRSLTLHSFGDIFDLGALTDVSSIEAGELSHGRTRARMALHDGFVYAAVDTGLRVVDVSDLYDMVEVGHFTAPGGASAGFDVQVTDGRAFFLTSDSLYVLDLTDPTVPVALGSIDVRPEPHGLAVAGSHVYVTDGAGDAGMAVIDASDPQQMVEVAYRSSGGSAPRAHDVAVAGDTAYIAADFAGLLLLDVSDPAAPAEGALIQTAHEHSIDVAPAGGYAYVMLSRGASLNSGETTAKDHALAVVDVTDPSAPQTAGVLDLPGRAYDIAARGSTVFMARGFEGLHVVDATDPANPQPVTHIEETTYELFLRGDRLIVGGYDADNSSELRIYDVTDPTSPALETRRGVAAYSGISVQDGYAYATVQGGYSTDGSIPDTLAVYDLLTSSGITRVGTALLARPSEVIAAGDHAYVGHYDEDSLRVVDISDPTAPVVASGWENENVNLEFANDMAVRHGLLYATAPAYSPSDGWASSVAGIDISSPTVPVFVGAYAPTDDGEAHRMTFDGDTLYVATSAAGFEILTVDATGVSTETPVGTAARFRLAPNAPNPFSGATNIRYTLPRAADVSLVVYDILGRRVSEIVRGRQAAGAHEARFDAAGLSSGIYFYRLAAGDHVKTRKMVVVR